MTNDRYTILLDATQQHLIPASFYEQDFTPDETTDSVMWYLR